MNKTLTDAEIKIVITAAAKAAALAYVAAYAYINDDDAKAAFDAEVADAVAAGDRTYASALRDAADEAFTESEA